MTLREFLKYVRDDSVDIKLVKRTSNNDLKAIYYLHKGDDLAWEGRSHLYNRKVIWIDTQLLYDGDLDVYAYLRICINDEPKEDEHDLV